MPNQRPSWATKLPYILAGLSFLMAAITLLNPPNPYAHRSKIDLGPAAIHTAEFTAAQTETYLIGVEMDQKTAKTAFPCMADPSHLRDTNCTEWPLKLSLSLFEDGADITPRLSKSLSTGGGSYGGEETYTKNIASVDLTKGRQYKLVAMSLSDATALTNADPKLVIELHPMANKSQSLSHLFILICCGLMTLVALIWAAVIARK